MVRTGTHGRRGMRIGFHGAAGEVTGSGTLVEHDGRRVLVDCGLYQGGRDAHARNRAAFPFDPATIDAVVLTHAHLDHAGRLPLLVHRGFRGRIHAQRATCDLAKVMLEDAAGVAAADAESTNRRRERRGLDPVVPLYGLAEVAATLARFSPLEYGAGREVVPGLVAKLHDAGHILGSAIVELRGGGRTLVCSGDLGAASMPLMREPATLRHADLVLLESTYGDRDHRGRDATVAELGAILAAARDAGGSVLIPAFAVGRTQELLFWLARHRHDWRLEDWHIALDSPMATRVLELYDRHASLFDARDAAEWRRHHPLGLPNLEVVGDRRQSAALNARRHLIVIAGAGMCTGGRILHHLRHRLWRPETHVVIVGYQAEGTPGRQLVDGARYVRILGEQVRVAARVHTVGGLSAHAGQSGLLAWYGAFDGAPPVALVHGEERARRGLAAALAQRYGIEAALPVAGDTLDVAARIPA